MVLDRFVLISEECDGSAASAYRSLEYAPGELETPPLVVFIPPNDNAAGCSDIKWGRY